MIYSSDTKIQQFLENALLSNYELFSIAQHLRDAVRTVYPNVQERMMYGGIMFSLEKDFGGIFINKSHVSFEFGNGIAMSDPHLFLEGEGKSRRHLKLRSLEDITQKQADFYIRQAV